MNILICVNDFYLIKSKVMLNSVVSKTQEKITLYILTGGFDDQNLHIFLEFCKERNINVELIYLKESDYSNLSVGDYQFTIEMYYRVFAPFLIPKDIERILYLDADLIATGDISELYNLDFDSNLLIAARDSCYTYGKDKVYLNRLHLPEDNFYFNSGVLLYNVKDIKKQFTYNYILEQCIKLQSVIEFPDQDVLNVLYQKKVKIVSWERYNYQTLHTKSFNEDNCLIMHFVGKNKPWDYSYIKKYRKYYDLEESKIDSFAVNKRKIRRFIFLLFVYPIKKIKEKLII